MSALVLPGSRPFPIARASQASGWRCQRPASPAEGLDIRIPRSHGGDFIKGRKLGRGEGGMNLRFREEGRYLRAEGRVAL